MRLSLCCVVLASLPLTAQSPAAPTARLLQPGDLTLRSDAAAALATALRQEAEADRGPGEAPDPATLRDGLRAAAMRLPADSSARARADLLLAAAPDAETLRLQVADLVADLTFRPVAEAELPAGVPGYRALDELEIRSYPAYRMVRTGMRSGSTGAFWPLFQHIQKNEIAMTTPVQVDYEADGRATSMAFLYGSPELGPTGKDGRVEVVDVPAMTVLTIGSRGYERPHRIAELHARLLACLDANADWEAAGPMRTMAYNSPSVGADRRYFEVQVPIRARTAAAAGRRDV